MMRKRIMYILWVICMLTAIMPLSAQQPDSIQATQRAAHRQKVAARNLHYNILGGPSYTPDFGMILGGQALLTFRTNPTDTLLKRSVVPVAVAFAIEGGINLFSKPQLFFRGDRFRLFGKFSYKNTKENFYGLGYRTNRNYTRSDSTSQYRYSGIQINPWFLFRLGESHFFAGPQIDVAYDDWSQPARALYDPSSTLDPQHSYLSAGGNAHGYHNLSTGVGFIFNYDSRDVPANAYHGIYLDLRGMAYAKWLGSDLGFQRLELDYRQYAPVGRRKILAWTVQSRHVFGQVPLTQYVLTGTPFDLRGYYMGQYRDRSSHVALLEYRQMINTTRDTRLKRLASHLGFVAWTGCGFMGPTPGKVEAVLPNYGVGLRIEVQPRMNVRLDFGKNTVNNQTLFYFNMTEAF